MDNPFDYNPGGHPDRTPRFNPEFDLYGQDKRPPRTARQKIEDMYRLGGNPRSTSGRPPQSDKAPIIRGGSIPEIQAGITNRDRERMNKAFKAEQEAQQGLIDKLNLKQLERQDREREEAERLQRENDIREMSELDRRTPKYGKFEGFPLPPEPGPEPTQNPFSPEEKRQRINQLQNQPNLRGRFLPQAPQFQDPWWNR